MDFEGILTFALQWIKCGQMISEFKVKLRSFFLINIPCQLIFSEPGHFCAIQRVQMARLRAVNPFYYFFLPEIMN